jgi:hypothetical protein
MGAHLVSYPHQRKMLGLGKNEDELISADLPSI